MSDFYTRPPMSRVSEAEQAFSFVFGMIEDTIPFKEEWIGQHGQLLTHLIDVELKPGALARSGGGKQHRMILIGMIKGRAAIVHSYLAKEIGVGACLELAAPCPVRNMFGMKDALNEQHFNMLFGGAQAYLYNTGEARRCLFEGNLGMRLKYYADWLADDSTEKLSNEIRAQMRAQAC